MAPGARDTDRLKDFDFASHNAEVRQLWPAFREGKAWRVPVIFGANSRFFFFDPAANPRGVRYRDTFAEPELMFRTVLAFQRHSRFNLLQDQDMGLPEVWRVSPDFQNLTEAAWFGCPVEFMDDQVPDTLPAFADAPERVMEHGLPDPFGGFMATVWGTYERFRELAEKATYEGRPVEAAPPGPSHWTDGPMTVACNLFSPAAVCEMMALEPERLEALFAFITEAIVRRMKAMRRRLGLPERIRDFEMADDSVALISTAMYREHVLPHHRRMYAEMGDGGTPGIHLCGDATRHFKTLVDELGVGRFDTGFPVDFAALRRTLGPDVTIQGGPHVELLQNGTPAQVEAEAKRILTSGVLEGGRLVLREGNNLSPGTPLENTEALYRAGRTWGVLGS